MMEGVISHWDVLQDAWLARLTNGKYCFVIGYDWRGAELLITVASSSVIVYDHRTPSINCLCRECAY